MYSQAAGTAAGIALPRSGTAAPPDRGKEAAVCRFHVLVLAFQAGEVPHRAGYRRRGPDRIRRRGDAAPPDGRTRSPAYVSGLRQAAFRNGLDLVMLSIHQDFVSPSSGGTAQKDVDCTRSGASISHRRWASPAVRLNSGRWNTVKSFDDLMKVKGERAASARVHERRCVQVVRRLDREPASRRRRRRA